MAGPQASQIAILGAGPSGLTLARLLRVKAIPYVIFDRDANPFASSASSPAFDGATAIPYIPPTLSNQGGTLDIHTETGQLALREAGLFEQFEAHARYDGQAFVTVDSAAQDLTRQVPGPHERGRPEIDRPVLREILLRSVLEPLDPASPGQESTAGEVIWEKKVDCVEKYEKEGDASGWHVRFEDGSVAGPFKLVVGADGTWSKTRKIVTPATPIYSGITFLQSRISQANPIYARAEEQIGRGTYFAVTGGKTMICQRMGNGSYNVYAGVPLPEKWTNGNGDILESQAARERFIREQYAGWDKSLTDLILHSDAGRSHRWPLHSLAAKDIGWESVSGVTLIGDAAHTAFTNGEGVNIGMFDALQLVREIQRCGLERLDEAVTAYEKDMFVRGKEHIESGDHLAKIFYAKDAPREVIEWLRSIGF